MSNPQQQSDERGVRKSKRQRVPNQYYIAGINQLRKITLKTQTKKNKINDDDQYSEEDQINNVSGNYRNADIDNSGSWLSCIMPNRKPIKVQIVIDSNQNEVAKVVEQPKKQHIEPIFNGSYNSGTIKKADSLNLLSLFQQAIKNVADESPSPVKNTSYGNSLFYSSGMQQPVLKHQQSAQKPPKVAILAPPPKRVRQQDKDGKLLKVKVDKESKVMKFLHSQMGQCQVPIQVQPPSWQQQEKNEEDEKKIQELRKKLAQHTALLKSIPIFN